MWAPLAFEQLVKRYLEWVSILTEATAWVTGGCTNFRFIGYSTTFLNRRYPVIPTGWVRTLPTAIVTFSPLVLIA
jgi:hypothetical protein